MTKPVAWQWRCKYDKGHARQDEWLEWHDTSEAYYNSNLKRIAAGDDRIQVRALVVAPEAQLCVIHYKDADIWVNGPFPSREAAQAWAKAEGEDTLAYEPDGEKWVCNSEDPNCVFVHEDGDEADVDHEFNVFTMIEPEPDKPGGPE